MPDLLKKYGSLLGTGLLRTAAPGLTQGALLFLIKKYNITSSLATDWVRRNETLWDHMDPEHQKMLSEILKDAGNLDWFTTRWLIEAVRKQNISLASLFLGWDEAYRWLEYQVSYFKKQAGEKP